MALCFEKIPQVNYTKFSWCLGTSIVRKQNNVLGIYKKTNIDYRKRTFGIAPYSRRNWLELYVPK